MCNVVTLVWGEPDVQCSHTSVGLAQAHPNNSDIQAHLLNSEIRQVVHHNLTDGGGSLPHVNEAQKTANTKFINSMRS